MNEEWDPDLPESISNAEKRDGAERHQLPAGSLLRDKLHVNPFLHSENDLIGGEKEDGVKFEDGNFVFDKETIDILESEIVDDFLKAIDENRWREHRLGYWFELESDDFIQGLAAVLRSRREKDSSLDLFSVGDEMRDKLESAADSLRERARNAQIRKALNRQLKHVPIAFFIGVDKDGKESELHYNPEDIDDPKNDVDFMIVTGENGEAELVIGAKNKGIRIDGIEFLGDPEQAEKKTFSVIFNGKNVDENPGDVDFTHYDVDVQQGSSKATPFFSKIRVLSGDVNLQEEIRKFNEEEDEDIQPGSAYQPQKPSVPSNNYRWTAPTRYTSSG